AMFAQGASAGTITDMGATAYYGGDDHGKGDLIGASTYDIMGATITRVGTVLTIVINTNFAGKAGSDATSTMPKGIGYGDVFLSDVWNPVGSDPHHSDDSAMTAGSTLWKYGFNIGDANRYNNNYTDKDHAGTFSLY